MFLYRNFTFAAFLAAATALAGLAAAGPVGASAHGVDATTSIHFHGPTAIAFDVLHNAYVSQTGGQAVLKLSPSANAMTEQWIQSTTGMSGIVGITADAHNHVFIVDAKANRVDKFSYTGKLLARWGGRGEFSNPSAIAIDVPGNVYVADTGHNRIVKLSTTGRIVASWDGTKKPAPQYAKNKKHKRVRLPYHPLIIGKFLHPQGVAVDVSGRVFVADTGHNRIAMLSTAGIPLRVLTHGARTLRTPMALAIGLRSSLWAVDTGNNRVVQMTSTGRTLKTLGGSSSMRGPRGMAIGANGSIYVADTGNDRIDRFSSRGQALPAWG